MRQQWSKERVVKTLRSLADAGNGFAGIRRTHRSLYEATRRYFGSFSEALAAAALSVTNGRVKPDIPPLSAPIEIGNTPALFLYEASQYPLLSQEETAVLARRVRVDHDVEARNTLARHNLRLVFHWARKYVQQDNQASLSLEDLVQIGTEGLLYGITKYDERRGFRLSTYVSWWIRQRIFRALDDHSTVVRIPVHVHQKLRMARRFYRECMAKGRPMTVEMLAKRLDISLESARELELLRQQRTLTLSPIDDTEEEQSRSLLRILSSPFLDPELRTEAKDELAHRAKKICAFFKEAEKKARPHHAAIFFARFQFLPGEVCLTSIREIAKARSITRSRVQQVIQLVLSRHWIRLAKEPLFLKELEHLHFMEQATEQHGYLFHALSTAVPAVVRHQ